MPVGHWFEAMFLFADVRDRCSVTLSACVVWCSGDGVRLHQRLAIAPGCVCSQIFDVTVGMFVFACLFGRCPRLCQQSVL